MVSTNDSDSLLRYYIFTKIICLCNNEIMSSFWLNVKKSLIYKEMEIKDLAFRSGVSYSTIINGMNKNINRNTAQAQNFFQFNSSLREFF